MNLLVGIDGTFLRHLSEILGKIHVLRMRKLFGRLDSAHLYISVRNGLLFSKEHDAVVSEENRLCDTDMDYTKDIAFDYEHRH